MNQLKMECFQMWKRNQLKKGMQDIVNLSSQENSDEDIQEARKHYAEMVDKVIQNLIKDRRSSRKRYVLKRFIW